MLSKYFQNRISYHTGLLTLIKPETSQIFPWDSLLTPKSAFLIVLIQGNVCGDFKLSSQFLICKKSQWTKNVNT